MTCEQFRVAYNRYLDGALGEGELLPLTTHTQQCQGCAAYRDAFAALDRDLRRLPDVKIPARLVRKLEQEPDRARRRKARVAWTPEVLRILSYGGAAVIASALLGKLPAPFSTAGEFLLAFAGVLVVLLSILQPIFLPEFSVPGRQRRSQRGALP